MDDRSACVDVGNRRDLGRDKKMHDSGIYLSMHPREHLQQVVSCVHIHYERYKRHVLEVHESETIGKFDLVADSTDSV